MTGDPFLESLARFRASHPGDPAVIDAAGVWSWSDLAGEVDQLAAQLAGLAGRRAVLFVEQRASSVALLAAAAAAGAEGILLPALYGEAYARELAEELPLLASREGRVVSLKDGKGFTDGKDTPTPVCLLTSGSTGRPKHARHTWATLFAAARPAPDFAGRRWQIGYPVVHFAGIQVLGQCLLSRGTLVLPGDFDPVSALAALRDHGADYLNCTPTHLRRILLAASTEDLSGVRLRSITLGGEIVDQQILDMARARLPGVRVFHTYGSTEVGASFTVRDQRAGFDPVLLEDGTLRVEDGELYVRRSPRAMLGYVGQPPPEEWVATGDLVEVSGGRVHFLGRRSEVINVGGSKVYPGRVEEVIREVEGVVDVRVTGHRSSIVGNLVKAVLWVEDGTDGAALREAVRQRCADRLPEPMVPRIFELTAAPELTVSQKALRRREA